MMAQPQVVATCVEAMRKATSLPVTVKHRTGIDHQDSYDELVQFARLQIDAGADALIVHARKAWLQGLNPKQNREIPPLQYDWVYRLKQAFPDTQIIINGGIKTLDECQQHLRQVDGVMLGREPYANPYMLMDVERIIYQQAFNPLSRHEILQRFYPYLEKKLASGMPLSKVVRHIMGLFHGQPGGKQWRRYLSEHAFKTGAGIEVIQQAAKQLL